MEAPELADVVLAVEWGRFPAHRLVLRIAVIRQVMPTLVLTFSGNKFRSHHNRPRHHAHHLG